jgi:hypothetical protein
MTEIYSNNYVKIEKDTETSIFTIFFSYSNQILSDSLLKTKIIQGGTSSDNYQTIKFKAHNVRSLKEYKEERKVFPINLTGIMLESLVRQLNYLIRHGSHTIMGYSPEDIIVINEKHFAFIGSEMITEIYPNNEMSLVSFPFSSRNMYVSPELLAVSRLPSYVHYKTSYFSLACVAVYSLLKTDEFYTDYLRERNIEKILEHMKREPIYGTKLYWLITRCLVKDPERRSIILI